MMAPEPESEQSTDDGGKTYVFGLVKLFERLEYAEAFRAGKLHLRKVRHFRQYTDANGALRGDPFEGIGGLIAPSAISSITIGTDEIKGSQLAAPLKMFPEREQAYSVLCFYALTNAGFESAEFESFEEMKTAVQLRQECFELGSHVVTVTQAEAFAQRVHAALKRAGFGYSRRLVKYFDPATFTGFFPVEEIPFCKPSAYAHQREYRFAVYTTEDDPCPMTLDVGDLSDITLLFSTAEFNSQLSIHPKPL